jgi:molybdate transport system permease protein
MTNRSGTWLFTGFWAGSSLLLGSLLLLPMLVLLLHPQPADLVALLQSRQLLAALRVTLLTSGSSLFFIFLLGLPTAYAVSRFSGRYRFIIDFCLELPMAFPSLIAGIALLLAFGRRGLFGQLLLTWDMRIPFTPLAVILVHIFVLAPFFVRRAAVLFDQLDPRLEEASQLLGGSPFFTFFHVSLPLCRRALLAEAIMIFAQSIGMFGAVILFAGNLPGKTRTLTLAIYDAFENDPEQAFGLAALLLIGSALLLLSGRLLMYHRRSAGVQ